MNELQASTTPDDSKTFEIGREQLPLHCPTPEMSLWSSHPRVFLSIDKSGHATCPYCGTVFSLKEK